MSVRTQVKRLGPLKNPFVMVVVPGTLHVSEMALRYYPQELRPILVLNGLRGWERKWAAEHLKASAIVTSRVMHPHNVVLEILFRHLPCDFGIADSDLLVFDPGCFSKIQQLGQGVSLNAFFLVTNARTGIAVPQTFFLFFRREIVLRVMDKYQVGLGVCSWQDLSVAARAALARLGFGPDNYPHSWKRFFDTLQALMTLCAAEGYSFGFLGDTAGLPVPNARVFHVGGVSYWQERQDPWRLRGAYFSLRLLERHGHEELRRRYRKKFGEITSAMIKDQIESTGTETTADFFAFIEQLTKDGSSGHSVRPLECPP
jgi:hypothetical protein